MILLGVVGLRGFVRRLPIPGSGVLAEAIDLENARVITLFGSHLGENMHNTQVQEFAEFLGRGGKLIVADPRLTESPNPRA